MVEPGKLRERCGNKEVRFTVNAVERVVDRWVHLDISKSQSSRTIRRVARRTHLRMNAWFSTTKLAWDASIQLDIPESGSVLPPNLQSEHKAFEICAILDRSTDLHVDAWLEVLEAHT